VQHEPEGVAAQFLQSVVPVLAGEGVPFIVRIGTPACH
jgi:hypothetical protein